MYIRDIHLKHYRNYDEETIEFDPKVNIIIGENAQGKTNLVEAIYLMGFGKSFRTNQDKDLIKMDDHYTSVSGHIDKLNRNLFIEYKYNQQQKKEIKINESPLTKLSELIGEVNVVIFSPEDLQLVRGTPTLRRRFMDKSISQMYPAYYNLLIDYNKVLKQRNNLLKQNHQLNDIKDMIFIWDEQLVNFATKIMKYRMEFLNQLKDIAKKIHGKISHEKEVLTIEYISNYLPKNLEGKALYDKIYSGMLSELKEKLNLDMKRGYTSVGPHRDDLSFLINDIDSKKFGSQGQVRTTALSLKLSEIGIIKETIGESPILILDDVLSELDHIRQNQLIHYISDIQTFITTTEVHSILSENLKNAKIIQVTDGSVINGI